MQAIEYVAPATVEEATEILGRYGERARVLAGGTDLIVQLREGRRQASVVVDVKGIPEVRELRYDPAVGLTVGAAVPCAEIYEHEEVQRQYPCLVDSASLIGGIQIQSRASLGGNLCNSSPAADAIPSLMVLGAAAVVAGPGGVREVPVAGFCTGPGRNVLERGEFLVALRLPPPDHGGAAFHRFIPRNEMDIAVCNAAAAVTLTPDGAAFQSARLALGAVAPTPLLVPEAGEILAGQPVTEEAVERAAAAAAAAARPITDMRGSAAQRRHLAAVLAGRALRTAVARARGAKA